MGGLLVDFSSSFSAFFPTYPFSYLLVSFGSLGLRQWGKTGYTWGLYNVVYDLVRGKVNEGPG